MYGTVSAENHALMGFQPETCSRVAGFGILKHQHNMEFIKIGLSR